MQPNHIPQPEKEHIRVGSPMGTPVRHRWTTSCTRSSWALSPNLSSLPRDPPGLYLPVPPAEAAAVEEKKDQWMVSSVQRLLYSVQWMVSTVLPVGQWPGPVKFVTSWLVRKSVVDSQPVQWLQTEFWSRFCAQIDLKSSHKFSL